MPALPWSARADQDAADTAAAGTAAAGWRPAPGLAVSTSVSWFCLAEELPVGWDEVQHRLRYAAVAGRVLS